MKQTSAASKIPTFPAADFWYLEFYDLRNKIFIFHHLKLFNIQQNSWSFLLNVNYSVRGQNYVWTLRYFSWCVAFLNRRDVLSNDLFVQIVRFILPIMISIYFHINNSTNMIMNEWDLTFMIGLVQFHSKTSTGWGIMDHNSWFQASSRESIGVLTGPELVCEIVYLVLFMFDDDVLKFIGV